MPPRRNPRSSADDNASAPAPGAQSVLYKSSALAATAPRLAFRRRASVRIAAAAAAADACREEFKAAQLAKAGCAVEDDAGVSEEARNANKYLRRLLLNRHSASASRLRKEAYTAGLERELAQLEVEYEELKRRFVSGGGVMVGNEPVDGSDGEGGGNAADGVGVGDKGEAGVDVVLAGEGLEFDETAFDISAVPELDLTSFLG